MAAVVGATFTKVLLDSHSDHGAGRKRLPVNGQPMNGQSNGCKTRAATIKSARQRQISIGNGNLKSIEFEFFEKKKKFQIDLLKIGVDLHKGGRKRESSSSCPISFLRRYRPERTPQIWPRL